MAEEYLNDSLIKEFLYFEYWKLEIIPINVKIITRMVKAGDLCILLILFLKQCMSPHFLKKSLAMNTRLSGTYNLQEKLVYTNNLCLQELF